MMPPDDPKHPRPVSSVVQERLRSLQQAARRWLFQAPVDPGRGEDTELAGCVDRLDGTVEGLRSGMLRLEHCFQEVGNGLELLPAASEAVLDASRELLSLRGEAQGRDAEDPVADHLRELRAPLAYLDVFRDGMTRLLGQLEQCVARINRLLAAERELVETIAPIHYLRSLFRVEVARLDPASQSTFLSLAEQMHAMRGQLGEAFASRFQVLRATRVRAELLIVEMRAYLGREFRDLAGRKTCVESCIAGFRRQLEERDLQNTRLESASREIVTRVGRMVVYLQAHDVFVQRLSHVLEVLPSARNPGDSGGGPTAAPDVREVFCMASVERKQVEAIESDLHGVERGLKEALHGISAGLEQILTETQADAASAAEAPLAVLQTASQEVGSILQAAVARVGAAHAELEPLRGQASSLTATIQRASLEMRLIAINAQVQAAHLGGGSALEVLAGEAASIAAQTGALGERVTREMDDLGQDLGCLMTFCDQLRGQGQEHLELTARNGLAREAELERTWSVRCGRVANAAEAMRTVVAGMGARSGVGSVMSGELGALRDALARLEEVAGERLTSIGETREGVLKCADLTEGRHTMESERTVALAAAQGSAVGTGDPASLTGTAAGEVELF